MPSPWWTRHPRISSARWPSIRARERSRTAPDRSGSRLPTLAPSHGSRRRPGGSSLRSLSTGRRRASRLPIGASGPSARALPIAPSRSTRSTRRSTPSSRVRRLPMVVLGDGGSIAAERDSVVVAPRAGYLTRIDARSGRTLSRIDPNVAPTAVAQGFGSSWLVYREANLVVRVDATGAITPIPVGRGPSAVTVGRRAVWVADELDGTVKSIDPATSSVETTVDGRERALCDRRRRRERLGGELRRRDAYAHRRAHEPAQRTRHGWRKPAGARRGGGQGVGERPAAAGRGADGRHARGERAEGHHGVRPRCREHDRRRADRVCDLLDAAPLSGRARTGRPAARAGRCPRRAHRERRRPLVHVRDPPGLALLAAVERARHRGDLQAHDRAQSQPAQEHGPRRLGAGSAGAARRGRRARPTWPARRRTSPGSARAATGSRSG